MDDPRLLPSDLSMRLTGGSLFIADYRIDIMSSSNLIKLIEIYMQFSLPADSYIANFYDSSDLRSVAS
jgi:hypothetical protein